jgi:hypothetical protein
MGSDLGTVLGTKSLPVFRYSLPLIVTCYLTSSPLPLLWKVLVTCNEQRLGYVQAWTVQNFVDKFLMHRPIQIFITLFKKVNTYLFQVQGHQYSCQFFSLWREQREEMEKKPVIPFLEVIRLDADTVHLESE